MTPPEPRVFLVGAGPGDPGLLTLRAAELLAAADMVLYDQLVPKRLLDFVNPAAETLCVRDLPGANHDGTPNTIHRMAEAAGAGKTVVRLKGGDPLVFGRGGEEADALRAAGVRYEIVPGVTAALAAAAYLDLPLTHRHLSGALALVTGHELPAKPGGRLDWEALARFPGTLAIYMGIARLPLIVAELVKFGKDPATPSAIVERASTGTMRTTFAPLHGLEQARRSAGLESPGLILVGDVLNLRAETSWFEGLPLFGKRVLVTRPRGQADGMVRQLERLGAVPLVLPVIDTRPPDDLGPLDAALARLREGAYDWVVFSSAHGVHGLIRRLEGTGRDLRDLGRAKLAAIGPKTADALREYRLKPDLVPEGSVRAEGFADALAPHVGGQRLLLARAPQGREVLQTTLAAVAASVEQVAAYTQVECLDPASDAMDSLRRGEVSFVPLTSSNIARSLLAAFDATIRGRVERGETRLVAISAVVGAGVTKSGVPLAGTAAEFTAEGLVAEMVRLATT
jgi:uroporphyrinogen III methyltransferase/synthase